jgi:hypothetical protein
MCADVTRLYGVTRPPSQLIHTARVMPSDVARPSRVEGIGMTGAPKGPRPLSFSSLSSFFPPLFRCGGSIGDSCYLSFIQSSWCPKSPS